MINGFKIDFVICWKKVNTDEVKFPEMVMKTACFKALLKNYSFDTVCLYESVQKIGNMIQYDQAL